MSIEEKQTQVLQNFRKDSSLKLDGTTIQFARANEDDLKQIQGMTTDNLILAHHTVVKTLDIAVSLKDCELEILMALEMTKRAVTDEQYMEVIKNAGRKI